MHCLQMAMSHYLFSKLIVSHFRSFFCEKKVKRIIQHLKTREIRNATSVILRESSILVPEKKHFRKTHYAVNE